MLGKYRNAQRIASLIRRKKIRWTSFSQHSTKSSESGSPADVEKIRNIGILAHIDAGKTTTTERMLYYSGTTRHLGDVDDGDTVTDYMPQERDRGITITSAAVTFPWKNHRINLIDTPGHVDFTMEVERCLRVLDGAVTVLDASAGVEAQTLTVWDQANRHTIPRIGFLNKMDKPAANIDMCLSSIRDKLNTTPLLLQLPIVQSNILSGVVDLVSMETVTWHRSSKGVDDGSRLIHCPLSESQDTSLICQANDARTELVEQVADLDDEFADKMLSSPSFNPLHISSHDLMEAVRSITLHQRGLPLLCGSSLKNKGVQLLMDAVNDYLPSPLFNKDPLMEVYGKDLCVYAFKIIHDRQRGPLIFLRVYSGTLKPQSAIYNASRNCTERVSRLLYVMADSYQEVSNVPAGNIAIAVGLKQTVTGDTLVASKASYNIAKKKHSRQAPLLEPIKVPEPVFFCTIEPPSQAYQAVLCCFTAVFTYNLDQLILSGMGELHLDIVQDRIRKEYKIDVELGPLQISYRETITNTATESATLDKVIGDKHHVATVTVSVEPLDDYNGPVQVTTLTNDGKKGDEMHEAVTGGAHSACRQGPLLGFPVLGVAVTIDKYSVAPGTSPTMLAACASQATHNALQQACGNLLEPVMNMEITTSEERLQVVLGDVARRRGQVLAVDNRMKTKVITAATPLAEMMGYSTALRSLTSGTASCSLEFSNYQQMSFAEQDSVIRKLTGIS
eukprot:XP_011675712.1 PREDICTED: ribosome-releasing factor 2, mitochondrial [Strongylocentrotus purpuratus]